MRLIPILAALVATFVTSAPLRAARAVQAEEEPQVAFSWAVTKAELGVVSPPVQPGIGGWQAGPSNTLYRPIPSFTGDPTYEVLVLPPTSGHQRQSERFLLQFPADLLERPMSERALVVGMHGFQQSEKSIFLNTELPWECASRGWLLVAPYGMTDTHFGNVRSQQALEACVRVVYRAMPFNHRRVYAVGFSMGGLAALSFGMRHLDVHGLRFAGVAVHTAPLDLFQSWNNASPPLRELLADDMHFGATPTEDAFEWERVSPVRFLESGVVDPAHAPVDNLRHIPVLLHANLADPLPHLVEGIQELKNHLLLRGAVVEESLVFQPTAGHSWGTMDFGATLDFLGEQGLGPIPDESTLSCDRAGGWLGSELRAMQAGAHARYRLERGPASVGHTNAFALTETRGVDELAIDVAAYGLDASAPLSFVHASADATYDTIVLGGYTSEPGIVSVDGVAPRSVRFDEELGELRIVPTATGRAVQVDVIP
jgi:predicted esterase